MLRSAHLLMAPPRKRITKVGEALRAAREAVHLDQAGLGARVLVSARQVSRWENGDPPTPAAARRILDVLTPTPAPLREALAGAFGIELPAREPPPPPVVAPPAPRPVADLRASFDAIIYAAAEEHDLLPRRLRTFAVDLLRGVDRLGLSAKEAAVLVAAPERGNIVSGNENGAGS
ncbi:MAG: helix-turn-helix domain-containing protein [Polyangiaceae bacterium]